MGKRGISACANPCHGDICRLLRDDGAAAGAAGFLPESPGKMGNRPVRTLGTGTRIAPVGAAVGKGWRRRIERHSDGEAAENVPPWHRLTPPHGSWDTSGFQKSRGLVHPGGSRWSRSGCAADHRPIRLLMSDGRVPSVAAQESSVRCGCRFVDRRVPFGSRRATGGFRTRRHASAE